jgi:membrane-associated phospholipid phosphatase
MRSGKAKIAISSAGVLGFVVISYFFFDVPITLFCKGLDRSVTDFFGLITEFGISTWYLVGSFGIFLIFSFVRPQKLYAHRALFLFASIAVSGIVANIIKVIIGRYRPEMLFEKGLYGFNFFNYAHGLTSFPSGHTATTFSLAFALSIFFPRYRTLLFCFALAVGASRVIITSHYLSDVVGGAYVGMISVFLLRQAFSLLERKVSSGFKI